MVKDIKILEKIMVVIMKVMNMMMELQMKRFLMTKALNLKHTAKNVKNLKIMKDITTKKEILDCIVLYVMAFYAKQLWKII